MTPAKPMKKPADVPLSPKPTDVDKKKNRLRKTHVAGPRRKPVKKRKTRRSDGAPKKKPASGPSKKHSGAKTKNHGGRWPSGRAKRLLRKWPHSTLRARSALLSKRRR